MDKLDKTLILIEDLIEDINISKVSTDEYLENLIIKYLIVLHERIRLGAAYSLPIVRKKALNELDTFWLRIYRSRNVYHFEPSEDYVLGLVDTFLYDLIKDILVGQVVTHS